MADDDNDEEVTEGEELPAFEEGNSGPKEATYTIKPFRLSSGTRKPRPLTSSGVFRLATTGPHR